MKKNFEIEGYKFVAILNITKDAAPLTRAHTLVVSHTGAANYQQTHQLSESNIEQGVAEAEKHAADWVKSRRSNTPLEKRLTSLGFKR